MRTITAHDEIDRLFAGGRRVSYPALLVLAMPTPEGADRGGRVLFVAGKRLGPAVHRNRCKRVLRETARRAGADLTGWDVALIARRGTADADPAELDHGYRDALVALGITR